MSNAIFARFVPGSARSGADGVVGDDGPAVLSGQLLARHAARLEAPILEITARKASALVGFLRACKHEDAIAVVAVAGAIRQRSPRAPALCRDGVLAACAQAGFEGPLVLVARAIVDDNGASHAAGHAAAGAMPGGDDMRLRERIARDVEAGYTSIGVSAGALHDADEWAKVAPLFAELDLGLELEIGPDDDAALLLAQVDDLELPISAVRGAGALDEIGNAALVVDVAALTRDLPLALRVCIDALIEKDSRADDDDDVCEARAWMATSRALQKLQARETATRLEDVLQELLG